MSQLILETDSPHEILLAAPRGGAVLRAGLLTAAALGVHRLLPGSWIAPAALGLLAAWTLAGALRIHQLRLDFDRRAYVYRRGWLFAPPRREGGFEDLSAVFLDPHEPAGGLVASRLRSRVIRLQIPGLEADDTFALGFPMGPRVAADKAADYARRLGIALVDRTRTGAAADPEAGLS